MKAYQTYTAEELRREIQLLEKDFAACKAKGLQLNMARGKPDSDQLALSAPMLTIVDGSTPMVGKDGMDFRNYGLLCGIQEARELMGGIMGLPWQQVLVGGSSSLNLMYDTLARAITNGMVHSPAPWSSDPARKFLCLTPGYDRHFQITQALGFQLIDVPLLPTGPDMDRIEQLVAEDASIKGIWCVPKYSNPSGITYTEETVRRLAAMPTAAPDFTVMWDNAYAVHHLDNDDQDTLADIFALAAEYGNEDRIITFASTSKITYPGAGIAALGASPRTLAHICSQMDSQTIGGDKLNMLRHTLFLQDPAHIAAHMARHAALLRPKFQLVLHAFAQELAPRGIAHWTEPKGGYFITCECLPGCAKATVALCAQAGVQLTPAGSTHPYGVDPQDSTIRIAPSFPPLAELAQAVEVFCLCARLAAARSLLTDMQGA